MRIAYFVHGNGRGHAMRAREIVPAMRERGHAVTLYAGGDAAPILHDLDSVEISRLGVRGARVPGRVAYKPGGLYAGGSRGVQLLLDVR